MTDTIDQRIQTRTRILITDLQVHASIGVLDSEKVAPQTLRVSLKADVDIPAPQNDDVANIVSYADIVAYIETHAAHTLSEGRHVHLLETFGQDIITFCLRDPRIVSLKLRIEKPDIYPRAESVGIELRARRKKERSP